jgi:multiple sugar transport system permease protein
MLEENRMTTASVATTTTSNPKSGKPINPGRVAAWILLSIFIFVSVFPVYYVLKTALTSHNVLAETASQILPADATLFNFARVVGLVSVEQARAVGVSAESANFLLALRNSLMFVAVTVAGQLLFSAMAAYAFARLNFPGRNFLFTMILTALMIPGIVLFIPNFILIKDLGWLNTFQGMIAPYVLATPFGIFFLRQFFISLPLELEEAAKLDGASPAFIFWRIVLPLARGPIATLGILTSINMWNEFLWPYLINSGSDENLRVLTVALQQFKSNQPSGPPDWTGLMAGTFISVVPVFLLLVFFGKQVVESLQFSGGK